MIAKLEELKAAAVDAEVEVGGWKLRLVTRPEINKTNGETAKGGVKFDIYAVAPGGTRRLRSVVEMKRQMGIIGDAEGEGEGGGRPAAAAAVRRAAARRRRRRWWWRWWRRPRWSRLRRRARRAPTRIRRRRRVSGRRASAMRSRSKWRRSGGETSWQPAEVVVLLRNGAFRACVNEESDFIEEFTQDDAGTEWRWPSRGSSKRQAEEEEEEQEEEAGTQRSACAACRGRHVAHTCGARGFAARGLADPRKTKPPPPPPPPLTLGMRVVGRFAGGRRWYPGRVRALHDDGTVHVAYDDGDEEHAPRRLVKPDDTKPAAAAGAGAAGRAILPWSEWPRLPPRAESPAPEPHPRPRRHRHPRPRPHPHPRPAPAPALARRSPAGNAHVFRPRCSRWPARCAARERTTSRCCYATAATARTTSTASRRHSMACPRAIGSAGVHRGGRHGAAASAQARERRRWRRRRRAERDGARGVGGEARCAA